MMSYKETNDSEKSNDDWCFYWYCYYYINHVKKKLDWNIKWPKFENISYCYKGKQTDIVYIYNANNSSEYTFYTQETVYLNPFSGGLNGAQGGGVFTSASTVDGVNIFFSSGNIASGTFTLFKVV